MSEIIEVTDTLNVELMPTIDGGEPRLAIRLIDEAKNVKQYLIVTIEEARDLVDTLPDAIVRLDMIESKENGTSE